MKEQNLEKRKKRRIKNLDKVNKKETSIKDKNSKDTIVKFKLIDLIKILILCILVFILIFMTYKYGKKYFETKKENEEKVKIEADGENDLNKPYEFTKEDIEKLEHHLNEKNLEKKIKKNEVDKTKLEEDLRKIKSKYGNNKKYPIISDQSSENIVYSEGQGKYYANNEILVKLKENENPEKLDEYVKTLGAEINSGEESVGIYKVRFKNALDETALLEYIVKIKNRSEVEDAILNVFEKEEYEALNKEE